VTEKVGVTGGTNIQQGYIIDWKKLSKTGLMGGPAASKGAHMGALIGEYTTGYNSKHQH